MQKMQKMQRVSFVGLGFVGLCTAVCFANKGFDTLVSTKNQRKAEMVGRGVPPFYEPQLEKLLKHVARNKRLRTVVGRKEAVRECRLLRRQRVSLHGHPDVSLYPDLRVLTHHGLGVTYHGAARG